MVRVAVGGISHETNTFATRALGLTELAAFRPTTGSALLRSAAAARSFAACSSFRRAASACLLYTSPSPRDRG